MSHDTDCGDHGGFGQLQPDATASPTSTTAVALSTVAAATTPNDEALTATPPLGPCLGGTDDTGGLDVTLDSFEDPVSQTDGLIDPDAGNRFVAAELTLTNTSDETQTFSTLLLVELIDSMDRSWDVSIFGVSDRPSIDGDIPAGESRRGWVGFEVPADASGFRLHVKGNITADGTTFTIDCGTPSTTTGSTIPTPTTTPQPVADVAEQGISSTGTTGDLAVTLDSFEDPVSQTDGLIDPDAGNRFVAAELTLTNTSDETQTFSTLLLVELIDSMDRSWDVSILGVSDRPSIDGDIPAGESRRGWVGFEVPADASGFRLHVKGNITADGTTFTIG